jgi:mono/diheme cytochrome c family protein
MKKLICISVLGLMLACTAKKSATRSESVSVSDKELSAAKTKFPDATLEALQKGHGLYNGTCTNCHGAKSITERSEEKWPEIIERMAQKAQLTSEEKDAVLKYVMGVKLASKQS